MSDVENLFERYLDRARALAERMSPGQARERGAVCRQFRYDSAQTLALSGMLASLMSDIECVSRSRAARPPQGQLSPADEVQGRRLPSFLSDVEELISHMEDRAAVTAERATPRNTPSSTPMSTPRQTPRAGLPGSRSGPRLIGGSVGAGATPVRGASPLERGGVVAGRPRGQSDSGPGVGEPPEALRPSPLQQFLQQQLQLQQQGPPRTSWS